MPFYVSSFNNDIRNMMAASSDTLVKAIPEVFGRILTHFDWCSASFLPNSLFEFFQGVRPMFENLISFPVYYTNQGGWPDPSITQNEYNNDLSIDFKKPITVVSVVYIILQFIIIQYLCIAAVSCVRNTPVHLHGNSTRYTKYNAFL